MVRARLAGLGAVLRQQPYEAALSLAAMGGLLELATGTGAGAIALYPMWLAYLLGSLLFTGGLLTAGGLTGAGITFGDVAQILARRVEQLGQYLLCGALLALSSATLSFGLRGAISGAVDAGLGCATLSRAVTISRVIARAGRDETGFGSDA